ncbi:MAG: glycoside hydrolase family 3 protein [Luteibaculaceae bacterium]
MSEKELHTEVERILSQMTPAQKIGQMVQTERMAINPEQVAEHHIGSVLSGGGSCPGSNQLSDWVDMNQAYYKASVQPKNGLPIIPTIYGVDAIHGNNNVRGATIFPHNIGLGCANDPDLLKRIAQVTAKEILAAGVEWTFAPTLALARNYQWGRTYESYSEHPEIVEQYAKVFVEGLQGDFGDDSVIACVKHWVGDGATTYGIDQGDTAIPEEELRALHMRPYSAAINAGVLTVMASFNSWYGNKLHGHKYLLTDVLKNELKFKGFVISDWDGIDYLDQNFETCVAWGVNAGIDMFMVSEKWGPFIQHLTNHVHAGRVPMERINDAVSRILYVKLKYGIFTKAEPNARPHSLSAEFGSAAHRAVAREAVRKSLVLLKNENDILPLQKSQRILVTGKNAHNCGHQCGGFTLAWQGVSDTLGSTDTEKNFAAYSSRATVMQQEIEGGTSIWEGIKAIAPKATLMAEPNAADAHNFDVAIAVIGETPYAEGMGDIRQSDETIAEMATKIRGLMKVLAPYGGSLSLSKLHPEDLECLTVLAEKGIPTVVVLLSGRPLIVEKELELSKAFVAAWLPGSEGAGIADVLFGDYNFQGKLSFTWQKAEGENYHLGQEPYAPKYPYGYGLNYKNL